MVGVDGSLLDRVTGDPWVAVTPFKPALGGPN
jgi:hypothetical protein